MNGKCTELSQYKRRFITLVKVALSYPSLKGNLSPRSITVPCPDKAEVAINPSENDYSGMCSNYNVSLYQTHRLECKCAFLLIQDSNEEPAVNLKVTQNSIVSGRHFYMCAHSLIMFQRKHL